MQSFLTNRIMKVVLNEHASSSLHINVGLIQVSIHEPKWFLIFINDLPNIISSQIGTYANDTTIYFCLNNSNKLKWPLLSKRKSHLRAKEYLVNFNASKAIFYLLITTGSFFFRFPSVWLMLTHCFFLVSHFPLT